MKIKVMCPSCKEVVDGDDDVFGMYCPICSKEFQIADGYKMYLNVFRHNMENANEELFLKTNYEKAHLHYVKAFNINQKSIEALLGVVMSNVKMSTIRRCFIQEATEMIEKNKEIFVINKDNSTTVIKCLNLINRDTDFYTREIRRRLSENEQFFEEAGLKRYLDALKQTSYFKTFYLGILERISSSFSKEFIDMPLGIKKDLLIIKAEIDKEHEILPVTSPHPMLEEDSQIDDGIFENHQKDYQNRNISLVLGIISIIGIIVGLSLIFALPTWLIIGVPILGVSLLAFVISLSVFLKKRKIFYKKNQYPFKKDLY